MPSESGDPADIRSIAVTAEDVVTAAETNRTSDRAAVLRVTPPFSGRMRARLHVRMETDSTTDAIHVRPDQLLAPDAPSYPRPEDTEDELRADPDTEYTVDRHREYHRQTLDAWRETIASAIQESVAVPTGDGFREVTVHVLGGDS